MGARLIGSIIFAFALVHHLAPEAQACDSAVYNDMFTMADSADRVLVVRATSASEAVVQRALKGSKTEPLPPIKTNCDPRFETGDRYLLFIGKHEKYYADTSAARLVGARGKRWQNAIVSWLAKTGDKDRSKLLTRVLAAELDDAPSRPWEWRLLEDIKRLPMPHPSIPRSLEKRLAEALAERAAAAVP